MSDAIEELLIKKAALKKIPIKGSLELTPLCNMNCRMCYIRHTAEEVSQFGGIKPTSFWTGMIPEMKKAGVLFLGLIGGEPFIYPDFPTLYTTFYKNGFYLNITTNGTLLADRVPEWLKECPPRYVTVSLYGSSDATYENVTGKKGAFYLVEKSIDNLLQNGINTKLNYCALPENQKDLEEIYKLADKWKIPILSTAYNFPAVRRECTSKYQRLTAEEAAGVYHRIKRAELGKDYESWRCYISEKKYNQHTERHTSKMYCMAGVSNFWINWKGIMTPCGMMETPGADLEKFSFIEAWSKIRQKTEDINISEKCACCEYREICLICPAMMKAETGSFHGNSEYHCQMTKSIIEYSI